MSTNDQTSSYGLYLQTVRVEKGVSIEKVAMETRIREDILRAIEAEDHAHLPDDVFVKGFLKSFADAIGADVDETLRRFAVRRATERPSVVRVSDKPMRKGASWWTLLWVAVVMAGLIGGTLMVYQSLSEHETDRISQGPAPAETAATEAPKPPETSASAPADPESSAAEEENTEGPVDRNPSPETAVRPAAGPAEDRAGSPETAMQEKPAGYVLEIVCEEDTWLKVLADDAPASEHLLKPGDTLRLSADKRFNLLIGNAGGVSLQLNGNPVPVPGGSGEVVNLELP